MKNSTHFSFSLFLLIFFFLNIFSVKANENDKTKNSHFLLKASTKISLITADPGKKIWSQYGHTGIRIHDSLYNLDMVFNYGLFSFSTDNFLWKFVTGETDYIVGVFPYPRFIYEYEEEHRGVTEQILNLTQEEKNRIWDKLLVNIKKENRTYRYNYFFNNCATQPRDLILSSLNGHISYKEIDKSPTLKKLKKPYTLRKLVHYYTRETPWTTFGIDLALGKGADDTASLDSLQFAPEIMKESFDNAFIINGDTCRKLVSRRDILNKNTTTKTKIPFFTPDFLISVLIILLILYYLLVEKKKNIANQTITTIFYFVNGIGGFVIAFLVFFSVHPTTEINYNLLWMHPINLLYPFLLISKTFRKKYNIPYLAINALLQVLAIFGTTIFIPQYSSTAMKGFMFILLFRAAVHFKANLALHNQRQEVSNE